MNIFWTQINADFADLKELICVFCTLRGQRPDFLSSDVSIEQNRQRWVSASNTETSLPEN